MSWFFIGILQCKVVVGDSNGEGYRNPILNH